MPIWIIIISLSFVLSLLGVLSNRDKKDKVGESLVENEKQIGPIKEESDELKEETENPKIEINIIEEGTNSSAVQAGSSRTKTQEIVITADFTKDEMEEYITDYFNDNKLQLLHVYTDQRAYDIGERVVDDYDNITKEEFAIYDEHYIIHGTYYWTTGKIRIGFMATKGKYAVE
ncbi:hypothetical protein ACFL14_00850 [Patescibacteria group bacterium]